MFCLIYSYALALEHCLPSGIICIAISGKACTLAVLQLILIPFSYMTSLVFTLE